MAVDNNSRDERLKRFNKQNIKNQQGQVMAIQLGQAEIGNITGERRGLVQLQLQALMMQLQRLNALKNQALAALAAPQVRPNVLQLAGGMNPQTQQLLRRYGIDPTKPQQSSTKTQRQPIIILKTPTGITKTENVVNHNTRTTNEIKIVQPLIPISQPQIRTVDPNIAIRRQLANQIQQLELNFELLKKQFQKLDWRLQKSSNSIMRKIEEATRRFAESVNPERMAANSTNSMKVMGMTIVAYLIARSLKPIQDKITEFSDWLTNTGSFENAGGFREMILQIGKGVTLVFTGEGDMFRKSNDDSPFAKVVKAIGAAAENLVSVIRDGFNDRRRAVKTVLEMYSRDNELPKKPSGLEGIGAALFSGVTLPLAHQMNKAKRYSGALLSAIVGGSESLQSVVTDSNETMEYGKNNLMSARNSNVLKGDDLSGHSMGYYLERDKGGNLDKDKIELLSNRFLVTTQEKDSDGNEYTKFHGTETMLFINAISNDKSLMVNSDIDENFQGTKLSAIFLYLVLPAAKIHLLAHKKLISIKLRFDYHKTEIDDTFGTLAYFETDNSKSDLNYPEAIRLTDLKNIIVLAKLNEDRLSDQLPSGEKKLRKEFVLKIIDFVKEIYKNPTILYKRLSISGHGTVWINQAGWIHIKSYINPNTTSDDILYNSESYETWRKNIMGDDTDYVDSNSFIRMATENKFNVVLANEEREKTRRKTLEDTYWGDLINKGMSYVDGLDYEKMNSWKKSMTTHKLKSGIGYNEDLSQYETKEANDSTGLCAMGVRTMLESAGLKINGHAEEAYLYRSLLKDENGWEEVATGSPNDAINYNKNLSFPNGYEPRAGDVVVWDRGLGKLYGHVAFFDGKDWVCDFIHSGGKHGWTKDLKLNEYGAFHILRDPKLGLTGKVKELAEDAFNLAKQYGGKAFNTANKYIQDYYQQILDYFNGINVQDYNGLFDNLDFNKDEDKLTAYDRYNIAYDNIKHIPDKYINFEKGILDAEFKDKITGTRAEDKRNQWIELVKQKTGMTPDELKEVRNNELNSLTESLRRHNISILKKEDGSEQVEQTWLGNFKSNGWSETATATSTVNVTPSPSYLTPTQAEPSTTTTQQNEPSTTAASTELSKKNNLKNSQLAAYDGAAMGSMVSNFANSGAQTVSPQAVYQAAQARRGKAKEKIVN